MKDNHVSAFVLSRAGKNEEHLLHNQWIDDNSIVGEQYVNIIKFKILSGIFSKSKVMNQKYWIKKKKRTTKYKKELSD